MKKKNASSNYKTKLKKSARKKLLNFSVIPACLATDFLPYAYAKFSQGNYNLS